VSVGPVPSIGGMHARAQCRQMRAPGSPANPAACARGGGTALSDAASDEALLAAYVAGDARAFAELYERHERPVYRFFLRQGAVPAQADDLMQDTWLAIVRHAAQYEPRARFTTWLYTIARSKLVDHWRGRDNAVSLDEAANDPDGDPPFEIDAGDAQRPDVQAMSRAQARAFIDAVEQLPPAQRETFLLQAEGGLSLEEIAAVTNAGHETVKSRLRYAMTKLRKAMEAWQ
jgi:RNA polymerase sigma-70 factor (ECF subfamily)